MNIISEHGYRQDGRKPHQIRNLNYKLGVYSQADGSAYLEQGNTKVCSLFLVEYWLYLSTLRQLYNAYILFEKAKVRFTGNGFATLLQPSN